MGNPGAGFKTTDSMILAYKSCKGSYTMLADKFMTVYRWLEQRYIFPQHAFGIYYDDPAETPQYEQRSDVGFIIGFTTYGDEDITVETLPPRKVAYMVHKGPYGAISPSYEKLYRFIGDEGFSPAGSPMEIYLNDPDETPEDELLTEIQVPVKKFDY